MKIKIKNWSHKMVSKYVFLKILNVQIQNNQPQTIINMKMFSSGILIDYRMFILQFEWHQFRNTFSSLVHFFSPDVNVWQKH